MICANFGTQTPGSQTPAPLAPSPKRVSGQSGNPLQGCIPGALAKQFKKQGQFTRVGPSFQSCAQWRWKKILRSTDRNYLVVTLAGLHQAHFARHAIYTTPGCVARCRVHEAHRCQSPYPPTGIHLRSVAGWLWSCTLQKPSPCPLQVSSLTRELVEQTGRGRLMDEEVRGLRSLHDQLGQQLQSAQQALHSKEKDLMQVEALELQLAEKNKELDAVRREGVQLRVDSTIVKSSLERAQEDLDQERTRYSADLDGYKTQLREAEVPRP